MPKFDEQRILARANELLAERILGDSIGYTAPEARPEIRSRQVRSLLTAIVEALNEQETSVNPNQLTLPGIR